MRDKITTLALLLGLAGCGPMKLCAPGETRCIGSLVEVCNGDGRWDIAEDCAGVSSDESAVFMCCPVPADDLGEAGHACLPASPNAVACPAVEE